MHIEYSHFTHFLYFYTSVEQFNHVLSHKYRVVFVLIMGDVEIYFVDPLNVYQIITFMNLL